MSADYYWAACTTHTLKCWPPYWTQIDGGLKTVEIRYDDRGYAVGDVLILREFAPYGDSPEQWRFTGRECERRVTHVLHGGQFGLTHGYVAMSLGPVNAP